MEVSDKILIVDSDKNIVDLLNINLSSEGFDVDTASTARDVLSMPLADYALVIVDAMEQPFTGLDLVSTAKSNPETEAVAFIIISDYRTQHDVIDALDAGADDFILKPLSLRETVARVKALMRRRIPRIVAAVAPAKKNVLSFGPLQMDMERRFATLDGMELTLTRTEIALLAMLLQNQGRYVSRLDIHRAVWPDEPDGSNERKVDTNISRLRKKLGDFGRCISSRSGLGYILSNE